MDENQNVFMAKVTEQAERYDDMKAYVMAVIESEGVKRPLTSEERHLFSVAYKNIVGVRRAALRVISGMEDRLNDDEEESEAKTRKSSILKEYRDIVEKEVVTICGDVDRIVREQLLPKVGAEDEKDVNQVKVFYHKMIGDYHRYLAEMYSNDNPDRPTAIDASRAAYKEAMNAGKDLGPLNSVYLGLVLNFSVFYYELEEDVKEACRLAREAFDAAYAVMDEDPNENKESALIMQLLRDNLTLWSAEDRD
ncbi:uncharacterized protein [Oscarella lobularis]|uniref:uncharacterized protein n=1 Tax=Oscarella lobularis TaxID=121494 RepID=UPI003313AF42